MAYLLIEVGLAPEAPAGSNVMVNLAVFRGLAGCGLLGFRHLLRWCCGPAAWTVRQPASAQMYGWQRPVKPAHPQATGRPGRAAACGRRLGGVRDHWWRRPGWRP